MVIAVKQMPGTIREKRNKLTLADFLGVGLPPDARRLLFDSNSPILKYYLDGLNVRRSLRKKLRGLKICGIAILAGAICIPFVPLPLGPLRNAAVWGTTLLLSLALIASALPKYEWHRLVTRGRIEDLLASPLTATEIAGPFIHEGLEALWEFWFILMTGSIIGAIVSNIGLWGFVIGACFLARALVPLICFVEALWWNIYMRNKSMLQTVLIVYLGTLGVTLAVELAALLGGYVVYWIGRFFVSRLGASTIAVQELVWVSFITLVGAGVLIFLLACGSALDKSAKRLIMKFQAMLESDETQWR